MSFECPDAEQLARYFKREELVALSFGDPRSLRVLRCPQSFHAFIAKLLGAFPSRRAIVMRILRERMAQESATENGARIPQGAEAAEAAKVPGLAWSSK